MLPSISVRFSPICCHATVNAITRHVVAGRLASWLVALDDALAKILEAEYRLARLVFPVIF